MKKTILLLLVAFLTGCLPSGVMQTPRVAVEKVPRQWSVSADAAARQLDNLLQITPDTQLQMLVRKALADNPDLTGTALRLKEAGLLVKQSRADRLPQLSAELNGSRSRDTERQLNNHFSAALKVGWEVDLWGQLSAVSSASENEWRAASGDLAAARISLAGQVMKTWLELISQQRILHLEEARSKNLELAEALIASRYRNGVGSIDDLHEATGAKASSVANLSQQRDLYQRSERTMKLLLGELPQLSFDIPRQLPQIHLPAAGLPAETIGKRPDLQAAYHRIRAADRNTQVAYKALLPNFRIALDLGDQRDNFSELLKGSPAWTLLGSLSAPIFNAGKLRSEAERTEYAAQRAFLGYRETLLGVFLEVENALASEGFLKQQEAAYRTAQQHAEASYRKYRHLYREGLTDIVTLLAVERTTYAAAIQRLETEKQRLANRVDLALSLGCGI